MTTPDQQRAIDSNAKRIITPSPAGSGKTRTAMSRVVRLLKEGVAPQSFCIITFTRKAASEMKERLIDMLGADEAARETVRKMVVNTIHALCLKILQTYGERIGYHKADQITVVDQMEAENLLERICIDFGYLACLKPKRWKVGLSFKTVQKYIEDFYSGVSREWEPSQQEPLARILSEYRMRLREGHVLDFGSLLNEATRLFTEHPDVLALYQERFKHVIVDECQDLSATQHKQLLMLIEKASAFLVGDAGQAIYSWRGARPEMLHELTVRESEPFELLPLRHCFRCGSKIVEAANKLIAHNEDPMCFPMLAASGREGKITLVPGRTAQIIDAVKDVLASAYGPSEIAILARKHSQLSHLAFELGNAQIPCHRSRSTSEITGSAEFKRFHAVLRLAMNPRDGFAFLRLVNDYSVPAAEYAHIRAMAKAQERGELEVAIETYKPLQSDFRPMIEAGWGTQSLRDMSIELAVEGAVAALDTQFGIFTTSNAEFWNRECPDMSLAESMEWFATWDADREVEMNTGDAVTLSTTHAFKGLEAPVIFVIECNQGSFPSGLDLKENSIEEARRLMYVAVTRAKESLHIHYRRPEDFGEGKPVLPVSQFISEMGLSTNANPF